MDFSDYLKSFSKDNTPWGDLARDFIASKSRAKTFAGITKSLEAYNACDLAIQALQEMHNNYLKISSGFNTIKNQKEN